MSSEYFTPEELIDVLVHELKPDVGNHVKLLQRIADYSTNNECLIRSFRIGKIDIFLYLYRNTFTEEQKEFFKILGITFIEKDKCFLMLSECWLNAYCVARNGALSHISIIIRKQNHQDSWVPSTRSFMVSEPVSSFFSRMRGVLYAEHIAMIKKKFYHLQESKELENAYSALSETRSQDLLITDCLPLLVLYVMLQNR